MVGDKRLAPGIDRASFTKLYEQDRAAADRDLQLAAAHAGTDGTGAAEVRQALDALGGYEAIAAQVMYLDTQHAGRPPGQVPVEEQALYAKATDLMQTSVLPAAKAVAAGNGAALEASYQSRHGRAESAVWWITAGGSLVLVALGGFQFLLVRRTRRLVNPALAGATVLTVAVTVCGAASMSTAAEDLRGAPAAWPHCPSTLRSRSPTAPRRSWWCWPSRARTAWASRCRSPSRSPRCSPS